MKTTITIETSSPEEAAKILALISGTTSAPAEATPKKKVAKKAPVVQVVEEAPVVEEVEVVESRTEAEVTAKAKELVAAASPAVLRGVLDDIIGAGVKISSAPTDKYDAIYDAVDAKLTEINDM